MLVLARKLDESIVIGENIIVKVISIDKGVVKLGIEAPAAVSIVRNELLEDVKDLNIAASKEIELGDVNLLSKILKRK
jgi:carbon storage regulator CsrA